MTAVVDAVTRSPLLAAGTWTPEAAGYQLSLREELAALVPPLVADAEASRRFPVAVLRALGASDRLRQRWQGGRHGNVAKGMLLAYELGRLLSGGLGTGVSLHLESALGVLHRCRERAGDLYDRALDGDAVCCIAVTEPGGGSDIAAINLTAERLADGSWVLDGRKRFISLARGADVAVVLARTGAVGSLTFFAVPQGDEGYEVVREYEKLGTRSLETCELRFDGVRLPDDARLSRVGQGFALFSQALTFERIAGVAQLVGALEATLELAYGYLRARPYREGVLWDHQVLRHQFADLLATQQLLWRSLVSVTADVQAGQAGQRDVAALKLVAATAVERALSDALQLFGGLGYTTDLPVERALRDARIARIGAGTDEVMRELVAGMNVEPTAYDAWRRGDGQ